MADQLVFKGTDYGAPMLGLEVKETDGEWRAVAVYQHRVSGHIVLHFSGDEYEGLGTPQFGG